LAALPQTSDNASQNALDKISEAKSGALLAASRHPGQEIFIGAADLVCTRNQSLGEAHLCHQVRRKIRDRSAVELVEYGRR
jgi:hypothetical protein